MARLAQIDVAPGLGLDPGREGYLTVDDGTPSPWCVPLPYVGNEIDAPELLRLLQEAVRRGVTHAVLEQQQQMGLEAARSVWTAAENYGVIKALLAVAGIRTAIKRPAVWKREAKVPVAEADLEKFPKRTEFDPGAAGKALYDSVYRAIQKKNKTARKTAQEKTKDLARQVAKRAAPGFDFRANDRCTVLHSGKVESYLMARLARVLGTGAKL